MPTTSRTTQPALRYRLYIDESGDHTYNKLDNVGHRYLALLGVWFRQSDDYLLFARELERFRDNLFGERPDNPVILHRSDILNRRGPFGILRDNDKRNAFDNGLLKLIEEARFKMTCVLLDKNYIKNNTSIHSIHIIIVWPRCLSVMPDGWSIKTL
ncbi:MAG TPA: hypothetical protein VGK82_06795 [Pyrinomonadaceae bacterium]